MQHNVNIVYLLLGAGSTNVKELGNFMLQSPVFSIRTPENLNANSVYHYEINSRVVTIVKSPDIGSAEDRARNLQIFVDNATKFLLASPHSPHFFLLAVGYNERVSAEDMEMVQFLKSVFGDNMLRDHTLIVLTGGGDFERDHHDTSQQAILGWINSQPCENLRQLVTECGGRVQLFGDGSMFEDGLRNQINQLLRLTDHLSQATGGRGYTWKNFLLGIIQSLLENGERKARVQLAKRTASLLFLGTLSGTDIDDHVPPLKPILN
ncbi:GTPase imap family member 5 [Plakobranchus ocellatus]|uniref:GTPase imap family member 5 n=1 Tax=Plakobranchus ocellatus TaxID=259542 RepID=A0AAV4DJT9_9GAST|nr:GTPase imap family member 5 [Plakobranchus ocellatus]